MMSRKGFTAAELIEKLSKLDQNKQVWMELDEYMGTINNVKEDECGRLVLKEFDWI